MESVSSKTRENENNGNIEEKIQETLTCMANTNGSGLEMVNKRIDIDLPTLKRLNAMLPFYLGDVDATTQKKKNEQISKVVCASINFMFEKDFKQRLDEL